MSYQVLARKWRPRSFDTLVGQTHVVRALTHALQQGRLHHAYLFTGTRGVGKTTIARILAKSLNCESGVSANPCGACSACQEIDSGRFVDLLEVDAATNTRVDEMRQLLENAVYAPTRGRYKVYVIDEVHMLSNAAFNAMLKTLEEPPEHVKFILATTDPQKIPVTVLSRCLQFNLKQMSQTAIVDHLADVLAAEQIPADELALRLVARAANGSMRDALSLLDQAIAYGGGTVLGDSVSAMLGALGNDHLYQIVEALVAADPTALRSVVDDLDSRSLSYDGALSALADLWVQIQAVQLGCFANGSDALPFERSRELADRLSPEYVQLAYAITLQGRAQLTLAPDPSAGFLMTLLRLYAFRPESSGEKKKPFDDVNALVPKLRGAGPSRVVDSSNRVAGVEAVIVSAASVRQMGTPDWTTLLSDLKLAGMVRTLASHCVLKEISDGTAVLGLSAQHRHLLSKSSQEKLQAAICEQLGVKSVRVDIGESLSETPAQQEARVREVALTDAVEAIEGDGVVRDLIAMFDASLVEGSIRGISA